MTSIGKDEKNRQNYLVPRDPLTNRRDYYAGKTNCEEKHGTANKEYLSRNELEEFLYNLWDR